MLNVASITNLLAATMSHILNSGQQEASDRNMRAHFSNWAGPLAIVVARRKLLLTPSQKSKSPFGAHTHSPH